MKSSTMHERFAESCRRLMTKGSRLLVAVSGGRDSVALCQLLSSEGYYFEIAHCNFHLRGGESDRDERFVRQMAGQMGAVCHVAQFDTERYAKEKGLSIEMAARELRYAFFEKTCDEHNLDYIAVGHHRDDAIETFFLNLLRGTGVAGLAGMRERNGRVVRPLLQVGRDEIDRYVEENGLTFVDDHTNATLLYQRNKIRHQLLPLLRELSPTFDGTMEENMLHLGDAAKIVELYVAGLRDKTTTHNAEGQTVIDISELQNMQPRETLLFELLRPYGFSSAVVGELNDGLDGESGRQYLSPTHRLVKDRQRLVIEPLGSTAEMPRITVGEPQPREAVADLKCDGSFIYCDSDKLRQPLTLRHWRDGDRFFPFGMRGSKLVSDYFSDRKLSLIEKERTWLLCDREGEIVWLVGMRPDGRWAVDEKTKTLLRIDVIK